MGAGGGVCSAKPRRGDARLTQTYAGAGKQPTLTAIAQYTALLPKRVPPPAAARDVLRSPGLLPPPQLSLTFFGRRWAGWIADAAEAAACPVDYVAMPLLALASVLIGHARWVRATPGWAEPPHLWLGVVGDSGTGKSPGADCLFGEVVPEIERRMLEDFPDRLQTWWVDVEIGKAAFRQWRQGLAEAERLGLPRPPPPSSFAHLPPQAPRLRQNDVTIEKVAELLAIAAPKGVLIVRDELAGWIAGMNAYHGAGRQFWLEAYGGRPYRVERKSSPDPIVVERLAVAVFGGVQPDKIVPLTRGVDDGLMGRFLWSWPEPLPFRLSSRAPHIAWAISALDRLRELELPSEARLSPIAVPLSREAYPLIEAFGRRMQGGQSRSRGLLRSAYGKARGHAVRLALVLEMLWWCGEDGTSPPPAFVSARAFKTASRLVGEYFIPMAERVYSQRI